MSQQKYQREIEEIIKQAGDLKPSGRRRHPKQRFWRLIWLYIAQSLGGRSWSLSPGRVMLIAVSLMVAALIVRVAPLAWGGLLLFIIGYGMFFVRPPNVEKRWQGQVVDREDSWWDRLRRKWK